MKNFLSRRKKSLILSAVAFGISIFSFQANAMENVFIDHEGKNIFNVQYYGVEDKTANLVGFFSEEGKNFQVLNYNLPKEIKLGLNDAFKWWAEILGPGSNISTPPQYFVGTYDRVNADAAPITLLNGEEVTNLSALREVIQNGKTVKNFSDLTNDKEFSEMNKGEVTFGFIRIGENIGINDNDGNFGWANYDYYAYPLAQAMRNIEITQIMFHEIGHSLGFLTYRVKNPFGLTVFDAENQEHLLMTFNEDADDPKSFTSHLRNKFGQKPKNGMWILTPEYFESENFQNAYANETGGKFLTEENAFIVDDVSQKSETNRDKKIYLYFEGENVTDALDGKTFTRADGEEISGVPINLWEDTEPEFSHSNLARSMMSHQAYRSYNNFMEAELALLQDIGYKIDRKNFYGKSIYKDNIYFVNDKNFSARENGKYVDGYNNSTLGIGLHVYGSNNNIIQRGNIFTKGYGGVGIRVDGLKDTITVEKNSEVHADGTCGMGILIAYGKNHEINVDGVVTANGNNGDAIHFEFGANSMGANTEYRGSFIRYIRVLSEGQPAIVKNVGLTENISPVGSEDFSFTDLNGEDFNDAMVDNLNISGKISVDPANDGRAIYIAEESFVKNININQGAEIKGPVASAWKKFNPEAYGIFDKETKIKYREEVLDKNGNPVYDSNGNKKTTTKNSVAEPLAIQYKGNAYLYTAYIPELVTNLNFNTDIKFSDEIFGDDNLKMNVNGGTLDFAGGTANVVSVNIAEGAKIIDGNFKVNDMTEKIAEGFSDETTGKIFNHGTIFANTEDIKIDGNLISDGTLQIQGDKKIFVSGIADLSNSTIEILNAQKNIPITVLTAEKIIDDGIKISGNGKYEIVGKDLIVTLE